VKLNSLVLVNYRNYQNLHLNFTSNINVIIGNNGAGKTNLLEAIYYLSTSKSFRVKNDFNLVKKGSEFAKITCSLTNLVDQNLKIVLFAKGKSLFKSNQKVNRSSDFIGSLNVVLFDPSDLNFFINPKSYRRRFINIEISKISKVYTRNLNLSLKLLKDRNVSLKNHDKILIETLTDELINTSVQVIRFRKHFTDFVNNNINNYFRKLFNNNDSTITLKYETIINDFSKIKEELTIIYHDNYEKDLRYQQTLMGCHKDDFLFYFDGTLVSEFASQGQRRMIMLALKFTIIEYIKLAIKDNPILLLDDVLSELDVFIRGRLFELIDPKMQVFITTTDINDISIKRDFDLYTVEDTEIRKELKRW